MRKTIYTFIILFVAAVPSASGAELDSFYEFGRKDSSGQVDEEDLTDEFYYSKYSIKSSQKLNSSSSYYVKYQYYHKAFDTLQNLDNQFHYAALGLDTLLYSKEDLSIKVGPDFEYKEKLYDDSDLDYIQMKFDLPLTLKKKGDWTILLKGGINYYDYLETPRDEFRVNSKLEVSKKFFDEKLEVSSFYKFQYIDREKLADRSERTYGGALELKVDSPFLKTIAAGLEEGMDNTRIYEDREDSYDYKFTNWHLKTKASLSDDLRMSLKYTNMRRTYADFDHDHNGFKIEQSWTLKLIEAEGYDSDLKFGYTHKQFRYPYVANPYDFHFNSLSPELEVRKKDDWKASLSSEIRFYDFSAKRTNDKIYYIARLGVEKYLLKKLLMVGLDYKYTFKNYLHKLDITEHVFRLSANYKF